MSEADFLTPLLLRYVDGRVWELIEAFSYKSDQFDRVIDIPAGFMTDFASIPRVFWRILPPTGQYGKAAVVHDWLYRTGAVTRAQADAIFLEGMLDLNVPNRTAQTMYWAVRLFGGRAYAR